MGAGLPPFDSGHLAQPEKPGNGVLLRPPAKPFLAPAGRPHRQALESGLALWDTLESCTIQGARDETIRDPVPNDVAGLLKASGICAVACNGAAAHRFYQKFAQPLTGLEALRLPSTSPANAAWTMPRLEQAWGEALAPYLKRQL